MFATIALPFAAYQSLPAQEFKVLATLARYSDRAGTAYPTVRQLARDAFMSLSTTWRVITRLRARGCIDATRPGRGRFVYTIAKPFRPAWPQASARVKQPVPHAETPEQAYPSKHQKEGARGARFAQILDKTLGSSLPPPVDWAPRMRGWQRSGFWHPNWGPKPNEPECWVPRELLGMR